jgi:hypothetical protein
MRFTTALIVFTFALASGFMTIASANPVDQEVIKRPDILPAESLCSDIEHLPDLTSAEARSVALLAWESDADSSTLSLKEILGPAMDLVESIVKYVAQHPWILLVFIIPALELWIPLVGFEAGGVVAGESDYLSSPVSGLSA